MSRWFDGRVNHGRFGFLAPFIFIVVMLSQVSVMSAVSPGAHPGDAAHLTRVTMTLDQRGVLARDREEKLFGGAGRYLPTGVYKKADDTVTITVGETDQAVMPKYVISDPVLKHYTDGNQDGQLLRLGVNVIDDRREGILFLINESDPTDMPPTVTIEGGRRFTSFWLGRHNEDDWHRMLDAYQHIPAIELVSERSLITAGYNTAKDIDDPVGLLELIDEAIRIQNAVSGLDENDPDPRHRPSRFRQHMRENNAPDVYMYMFYNHTGYQTDAMRRILNTTVFQNDGWGPWHEFGHTYQQNPWKWSGIGEVTVNIYSLNVERHFGNRSRLERESVYPKIFQYLSQADKNYQSLDDLFAKLGMFWQLQLAFGDEFYPTLHRKYREMPADVRPQNEQQQIQQFIVNASEVAQRNLAPFFQMWGLYPSEATVEAIQSLPPLTSPIWLLTDRDMFSPVVSLRAPTVEPLGFLAGQTITGVTPVHVEVVERGVAHVKVSLDDEVVYEGVHLPDALTIDPVALSPGRHTMVATVTDDRGFVHETAASFDVDHFRTVIPVGDIRSGSAIWLSGDVSIDLLPVVDEERLGEVVVYIDRVVVDLFGDGGGTGDGEKEGAEAMTPPYATASTWPASFSWNTLNFDDGAYDLTVATTTAAGVVSETTHRVVLSNWATLDDRLLPPSSGWFGTTSRLEVVDMSDGWAYTSGDTGRFFGDDHRMVPAVDEDVYLTWAMDNLVRYEVTVFAPHEEAVTAAVRLYGTSAEDVGALASADWVSLPYTVVGTTPEPSDEDDIGTPWYRWTLTGAVAKDVFPVHFLRMTLAAGSASKEDVQIGHVRLEGLKDGANRELLPD